MSIESKNKVYGGLLVLVVLVAFVVGRSLTTDSVQSFGSAQTTPTYLTDPNTLSSQDSLYVWGIGTGQGLEVRGVSYLTGAVTLGSTLSVTGTTTISGVVNNLVSTEAITASNTILTAESNKVFFVSGATSTQTLPTSTVAGQKFSFFVGASVTGNITVVTNASVNNINGTLIVAGAVVDCDNEDTITFVADGENVGDFFSLISTGSGWLLGESGALTASKLTCTAT